MPSGGLISVFSFPISAQLVLSTVPPLSWKLLFIALLVSSLASPYIFWNIDQSQISIIQSEVSIQVTWTVLTNERSVFRSRDQYWPIRGQYSGHVTSIDQSQVSIVVTWPVLTNQRPVWTYGHDLDLAIVPTLGLSAWLARENGKIFDQSEDSLRVLTNQRTCWPSQSQINERLPPQHLDNDSLNWRQKIVLMLYWAPGAKPTWQFRDRMNKILDFNLTTNKRCCV